jgi:hypothetical protein
MSEFDTGYSVVIGKPVIRAEKKATGSSVSFPCEAIADGSYLVSLEVNGTVKAYRESLDFSSGSCTVGAYTLSYASYDLTVSGTSNNDIVRVMVEPLEVKTTDAFRAAVKKDAPKSEGGGSGGGVSIQPMAFIVISNGEVKLLQMTANADKGNAIINMVPEVIDKVTDFLKKKKEGNDTAAE